VPTDRRRARRRGRPQQFSNPLNAEAHYETTAPEIDEALDGEVGAVVAGCGTGGTLMGMARYFRERDPDTYVVAVEPAGSAYREFLGEEVAHEEYKTEGIGTHDIDTNELFDPALVDDIQAVPDREVHEEMGRLAAEEGQLVASSAAANAIAAKQASRSGDSRRRDRRPYDTVATAFRTPRAGTSRRACTGPSRSGKGRVGPAGGEKRQRSERRDNRGRLPA